MTEYDWSPEAYERALENQNRVSNWVHDQSGRLDQYSNPFVPRATSVPPSQHLSYHSSSSRHSRNRSGSHYPAPVDGGYYRSSHSHSPSRSHHSSPPPSYHTNPPGSSYTSHHTAIPFTSGYAYDPVSKQLSLPPLRGGQQYVIIPPKGRDVRIINDDPHTTVLRPSARSPTRSTSASKKDQPLLKRLFTNLSPSAKSGSRQSASSGSTRRDRSRSY